MKKNCAEQKRVGREQINELNLFKFKKFATENAQCPQKKREILNIVLMC